MTTRMLINAVESEEYRIAIVKDGKLDGFFIDTSTAEQRIGNIYKGVVERVAPSLQACFVDIGTGKNGFIQASEIHPEYYINPVDSSGDQTIPPVDKIAKKGQELLVQVTKEMPGRKGAHLTTYISLASRCLVLTPGKSGGGISRKIEDEEERKRLKAIMNQIKLPDEVGYIMRTAAVGTNKRELSRDLNRLVRMWKNIRRSVHEAPPLSLIHKEQDIWLRTLRDYFTSDVTEILVDDKDTYVKIKDYMKIISPRYQRRVKLYKEKRPIFEKDQIEHEIETIYSNVVPLKSGGSLVIDPTEALISIDVNSGRGRGGKDVEGTAFKTNMEAASEITRQLRLRDVGGLIVIDFIDMRDKKHIREIERVLREESKKDRAKMDHSHISKFGLLELSRQRLRPSLESRSYQTCEHCQGRGLVLSVEARSLSFLRRIWMGLAKEGITQVKGLLPLEVATYLQNRKRKEIAELESRYKVSILLEGDPAIFPGGGKLEFLETNNGPEK
jgi:ribonuclease E